jgi:hypothetical protein
MFEPLALPVYCVLAFGVALSATLVPLLGFRVAPSVWSMFLLWPSVALSGMLLRRVGHSVAATAVEATGLMYGQGLAFLLALFPLTALSAPFADAKLAAADAAMGFDWVAYARFVEPWISPLLLAYRSFAWQPLLIVALLVITKREKRLWWFVNASAIASFPGLILYPLMPARGTFEHYNLTNYTLLGDGARSFGPIIELIKAGHRTISPDLFTGFISMPSYHAAAAAIFTWAVWPLRFWRWPFLVLNLGMIAASPVIGAHYFVDIIAGVAVTAASILVARRTKP